MAQVPTYQTHLYPQNGTQGGSDGRSYSFEVGRSSNRPWNGPGLDQQMYGNLVQTDDPARPTWVFRKAIMVPSQTFNYTDAIRVWNMGHQTGGGVGYNSGSATSQLALDIYSPQGNNQVNGVVVNGDSNGVHHTVPYFQRSLNGGGNYDPAIDWYRNTTKHYEVYEFSFDTWYYFEVAAQIYSDGSGFWTEKVNGVTWINHYVGPLHLPGVSTSFYPNNAGQTGWETIEGAYEATVTSNQKEFIVYHTMEQAGSSVVSEAAARTACIADAPTVSLGDHSRAISGGSFPDSFSQLTGSTIDTAGYSGGVAAPVNSALPTLSTSAPVVGTAITTTTGTWSGSPTFAYQWQVSADGGTTWGNAGGSGTASAYTPVTGDVGKKLRASVTATNGGGSTVVNSTAAGSSVAAAAGGTVTLGHDVASGSASALGLSSNFKRGNKFTLSAPATLVDLKATLQGSGATGTQPCRSGLANVDGSGNLTTIAVISSDITVAGTDAKADRTFTPTTTPLLPAGDYAPFVHSGPPSGASTCVQGLFEPGIGQLRFQADTFSDGTAAFASPTVGDGVMTVWATLTSAAPPAVLAPVNDVAPVISGSPVVGQTLNCSAGTWENSPTLTYQWSSSPTLSGFVNIPGATSQSYTIPVSLLGQYLICGVSAFNSAGSATTFTVPTAVVTQGAPGLLLTPIISGVLHLGSTLTTTNGTWTNTPTSYAVKWQRSTDGATAWGDIVGGTSPSYTLGALDVGVFVRSSVTATNITGSTTVTSSGVRILTDAATRSLIFRIQNLLGRLNAPSKRIQGTGGGV